MKRYILLLFLVVVFAFDKFPDDFVLQSAEETRHLGIEKLRKDIYATFNNDKWNSDVCLVIVHSDYDRFLMEKILLPEIEDRGFIVKQGNSDLYDCGVCPYPERIFAWKILIRENT